MSKCFDHKTAFPETHSKIPPDSRIYASNAIAQRRLQTQKSNLKKQRLGFAAYVIPVLIYIYIYSHIYIYTYIYKDIYLLTDISLSLYIYTVIYLKIVLFVYLFLYLLSQYFRLWSRAGSIRVFNVFYILEF